MDRIIWTENFSVGNKAIDKQHKRIIEIINTLIDNHNNPVKLKKILAGVIKKLDRYSRDHLEYEEALLNKLQYPDFNEHKVLHFNYKENIAHFAVKASTGETTLVIEMLDFLKEWWIAHILIEDMKYKSFLEEKLK